MPLEVYSRRWRHRDSYEVERTENGWSIKHITIDGECDPTGEPYLFENLRNDSITYLADLGEYLEFLWRRAKEENLPDDRVQQHLDELGRWIQLTEKYTGGIFADYG